jgi:hypothetical protein
MDHLFVSLLYFVAWFSLMLMALSLFRFRIKYYWQQLIWSSLIVSHASLFIIFFKVEYLMTLIQPLIIWLCFVFILRIHWFHSALLVLSGYAIDLLLEVAINLMLAGFNSSVFVKLMQDEVITQGIIVSVCNFLLAFVLYKFRLGFSFLSSNLALSKKSFPRKIYITLGLSIFFVIESSLHLFIWEQGILLTYGSIFLLLAISLHLYYRKEIS